MKFQRALVSILSAAASMPMALSSSCVKFPSFIKTEGDINFVGSDRSNIAIGDQSIGTFFGVDEDDKYPNQNGFHNIDLIYDSVCTITETGYTSAPTCNYNFQMSFCRGSSGGECVRGSFSAYGKGPGAIKITGGTGDLYGATGEIETGSFVITDTGGEVPMKFNLCYGVLGLEAPLKDIGIDPDQPLGLCEGDCDKNEHCEGDLVCFHRTDEKPVPGCSGAGSNNYDYCISPTPGVLIDYNGTPPDSKLPLGRCEGDCDNGQCGEGLKCFQRSEFTPVPGCYGDGRKNYDYCVMDDGDSNRRGLLRGV